VLGIKTVHKLFRILLVAFFVVIVASLMVAGQAQAAVSCHKINAKGVGEEVSGGQTVAQIKGGGFLQGTSEANFEVTDVIPPLATIEGTISFTTNKATLSVDVAGFFNIETGEFFAAGDVSAATGKLAGASGHLEFNGVQELATGEFEETITGEICVDLAP
jgi:hypothetical protein